MRKYNRHPFFIRLFRRAAILSLALFLMLFTSCTTSGNNPVLPYFHLNLPSSEVPPTSEPVSEPEIPSVPSLDESWTAPEPLPEFDTDLTPEIHNVHELDYYVEQILKNRIHTFYFYACDDFTIDNDLLLYRYSLPYVSTSETVEEDGRSYWYVYFEYYPGVMIADAYKSGITSNLTDDEFKTYNMAVEFIENEVNPESDPIKKERLIHDYICNLAVYDNPEKPEPVPRHCTAVGLLLDGRANCQGYTDAFNMLASMAGFEVQSQTGYAEDSRHVWNIIKVYDNWYVMDVTYDHTTFNGDGTGYPAYIYFNAGRDILGMNHEVIDGNHELRLISETDENYFYFCDKFSDCGYLHKNGDAVIDIAVLLDSLFENNGSYVSYYAPDTVLYSEDLANPVYEQTTSPDHITVSTYQISGNTYICAHFNR